MNEIEQAFLKENGIPKNLDATLPYEGNVTIYYRQLVFLLSEYHRQRLANLPDETEIAEACKNFQNEGTKAVFQLAAKWMKEKSLYPTK